MITIWSPGSSSNHRGWAYTDAMTAVKVAPKDEWLPNIAVTLKLAEDLENICKKRTAVFYVAKTQRDAYCIASFNLAREHNAAVASLVRAKFWNSSKAMIRPMLEASARFLWFAHFATEEELKKVDERRESAIPDLGKLLKMADCLFSTGAFSLFLSNGLLHSFTHCGISAMSNSIADRGMEPGEQTEGIRATASSTCSTLLALCILCQWKRSTGEEDAEIKEVLANFSNLRPTLVSLL